MIYCNKIQGNAYCFGAQTDDITGVVRFFADGRAPEVERQPNRFEVPFSAIMKLQVKYKERFVHGDFPDKLSFER